MWGETYCQNWLFFILEPLEGEASGKGFHHLWTKCHTFACPVPIANSQRIFVHREAHQAPLFAYLKRYCHNHQWESSGEGNSFRRSYADTSAWGGREYKFTRVSAGLRTFQFANSAFSAAFEKHPKAPTAPSGGAGMGSSLSRDVLPPSAQLGNLGREPVVGKAGGLWRQEHQG